MTKKTFHFFHKHYHFKYKNVYRHAKKLFFFDLGLLALAIAMFGASIFLFFYNPGITDLIDLNISLGEQRIKSGGEVKLTIDYRNRSKHKLLSPVLSLQLPDGFIVDRSKTPTSYLGDDYILQTKPEIKAGAKGEFTVYGWYWNTPKIEEKIIARLAYTVEETERKEQKISRLITNLPDSILVGELKLAQTAFVGQPVDLTYTLINQSDRQIDNISIKHNWSSKIFSNQLEIFSLPAGQIKKFTGKLQLPQSAGSYNLQITPQVLINNKTITQTTVQATTKLVAPNIASTANFSNTITYADAGMKLPLELSWKNNSSFAIQKLQMVLTSNYPQTINWAKTATENNIKYSGNTLIIDEKSRTKLSDGSPNSSDKFTIKIFLNSKFNLNNATKNAYLEIIPTMKAGLNDITTQTYQQVGNKARVPLASQINILAQARYYTTTGDLVGRGPVPPKVGEETKYTVYIQITNGTNAIKNSSFHTSLPAGVEYTDRDGVTIGPNLTYNKQTGKLNWQYSDQIPANSTVGIFFEVKVKPTTNKIGKKINLTNEITFDSVDAMVNKKISWKQADIDNVLASDDKASKNGYLVSP